ncbi:MAG: uncharacterized protein KVP18_001001 [Porospora cf. gigantea A]|uniref:uncharacterized protein n=1 Tax=Porospora cf. gigantea A TaxID=2853593 RepID=UPI003559C878|nr:MAG: hypothetical protein KVP18_001001 [Porospora cf. gigantea A]
MWIALTLLALTAISSNGVSTELDLPAGVAASESREVDVDDELLREDYFDEHVGPQIKSPLLDRIHQLDDQPLLSELRWVPELLSLVHAFMSCCFYGLLMAKVRLDGTVFGISIQTILAMTVTEAMMASADACGFLFSAERVLSHSVPTALSVLSLDRPAQPSPGGLGALERAGPPSVI